MNNIGFLTNNCMRLLDLGNISLAEEFYYNSLPFCIIDAIFSIGVKYSSTRNTVIRYCEYFDLDRIRPLKSLIPSIQKQQSVSEFMINVEKFGIDNFTNKILKNRQRTSAVNGILKTEAVYIFSRILANHGVEYLQDINKVYMDKEIQKELLAVKGQGSGISLQYFFMLAGDNDLCKPDRHVMNFLHKYCSEDITINSATDVLQEALNRLKSEYPKLNVRILDYKIWSYMANEKKKYKYGEDSMR